MAQLIQQNAFASFRSSVSLIPSAAPAVDRHAQFAGLLRLCPWSRHERVEAFGEPAIDRSEEIASLLSFALIARAAPCSSPRAVPKDASFARLLQRH